MLLEFELENEAAFASAGLFSMVAGKLKDEDNGRLLDVGDIGHTKGLTSALILGKNGSGKSTLVRAMRFVAHFVKNSANESQAGNELPYTPNLLVAGLESKPTRYRVTFSMNGTIYEFEFAHNKQRIVSESLQIADRSVRFRKLYDRRWNDASQGYEYVFGEALTGRRSIWQESTRENALFLSTAVQLNSEVLKPAFDWLSNYFRSKNVISGGSGSFTARKCFGDPDFTKYVVLFMQAMDVNIDSIEIEEEEIDTKFLFATFSQEFIDVINKAAPESANLTQRLMVYFRRKKKDGTTARFPLSVESTGTKALFDLAGPLFDVLQNGYCLLVDEINTNLHPVVVSFLVSLFNDRRHNRRRAQLIFTSHDTSILAQRCMRRDQVWLIENDGESANLTPLSDFAPRKLEALDKGYLGGRYGGIPNITPALLPPFGSE